MTNRIRISSPAASAAVRITIPMLALALSGAAVTEAAVTGAPVSDVAVTGAASPQGDAPAGASLVSHATASGDRWTLFYHGYYLCLLVRCFPWVVCCDTFIL